MGMCSAGRPDADALSALAGYPENDRSGDAGAVGALLVSARGLGARREGGWLSVRAKIVWSHQAASRCRGDRSRPPSESPAATRPAPHLRFSALPGGDQRSEDPPHDPFRGQARSANDQEASQCRLNPRFSSPPTPSPTTPATPCPAGLCQKSSSKDGSHFNRAG